MRTRSRRCPLGWENPLDHDDAGRALPTGDVRRRRAALCRQLRHRARDRAPDRSGYEDGRPSVSGGVDPSGLHFPDGPVAWRVGNCRLARLAAHDRRGADRPHDVRCCFPRAFCSERAPPGRTAETAQSPITSSSSTKTERAVHWSLRRVREGRGPLSSLVRRLRLEVRWVPGQRRVLGVAGHSWSVGSPLGQEPA